MNGSIFENEDEWREYEKRKGDKGTPMDCQNMIRLRENKTYPTL